MSFPSTKVEVKIVLPAGCWASRRQLWADRGLGGLRE